MGNKNTIKGKIHTNKNKKEVEVEEEEEKENNKNIYNHIDNYQDSYNENQYKEIIPYIIPKWKIKKQDNNNEIKSNKENENENKVPFDNLKENLINNNEYSEISNNKINFSLKEKQNFFQIKDIRKLYELKEVIGGGNFGTVRIGMKKTNDDDYYKGNGNKNENKNKIKYAIKSIEMSILKEKDLDSLMKEVDILSNLDHPNIIKFIETFQDNLYFHIVMELCTGKELIDKIIESKNGYLSELKTKEIIYKVLSAINYCHKKGITHRDIKPENILFENEESDSDIKIIDFGLSRKYSIDQKMTTILGTPYYVAPEVLKGEYDEKCDIWSIGAITFIMLYGTPPFTGVSNNEIFYNIINKEISFEKIRFKEIKISDEGKKFMLDCMQKNPEKRPNAENALDHIWFKNI
jgi:calcium-dependent protein kinase